MDWLKAVVGRRALNYSESGSLLMRWVTWKLVNRNFEKVIGKICLSFLYFNTAASTKSYILVTANRTEHVIFFISSETLVYHVQQN